MTFSQAKQQWRRARSIGLIGAGTLVGLASLAPAVGFASVGAASTTTVTFTVQGQHTFSVPAGVTKVDVLAIGGSGAKVNNTPGGDGAKIAASGVAVTAGSTLWVNVNVGGGKGGDAGNFMEGVNGGNGGGESDVRTGSAASSRLVVAGGGGGAGFNDSSVGGSASSLCSPSDGQVGDWGGDGATCSAGGDGGDGTNTGHGWSGSAAAGGAGGTYKDDDTIPDDGAGDTDNNGGGGGGAGWFGGGGGAGGIGDAVGGGGGGSSFGGTLTAAKGADPLVSITYAAPVIPPVPPTGVGVLAGVLLFVAGAGLVAAGIRSRRARAAR